MNRTRLATDNIPSQLDISPQARLEKLQNDLAGIYSQITAEKKPDTSKMVLVVDEDENIQENVKIFLEGHGLKVTSTSTTHRFISS